MKADKEMTVLEIIDLLDKRENKYGGATGSPRVLELEINGKYLGRINAAKLNGWGDGCVTDVVLEVETEYPIISNETKIALEKQIPKKPIERFTGDEWICECPVCKGLTYTPNEVVEDCIRYCGWCGQKLDWGEGK